MEEKSCLTCKNFTRYYYKAKDKVCFKPVFNGTCIKVKLPNKIKFSYMQSNNCPYWEVLDQEEDEIIDKQRVEKALIKAVKDIEKILVYLENK